MKLPKLSEVDTKEFSGKTVLMRADFNVPVKDGRVLNDFRIKMSVPTLKLLTEAGARVIVISHAGDGRQSLSPMAECLAEFLPQVSFCDSLEPEKLKVRTAELKNGDVLVVENLRRRKEEEENNASFANDLASLADMYVNDAFSSSHRGHASIVGVPKLLRSFTGLQFEKEYEALSRVFEPDHPFFLILGGAKFETKMPLLRKFLHEADDIFVGGALVHSVFEHMGYGIGKSLTDDSVEGLQEIIDSKKVFFPVDVVVDGPRGRRVVPAHAVEEDETIFDAGPQTIEKINKKALEAAFILWNGPLGHFEKGFDHGTKDVASAVADSIGEQIVGGGDTIAAISELGLFEKYSFVSTAGGAMLEFLSTETLPGIEAIQDNN